MQIKHIFKILNLSIKNILQAWASCMDNRHIRNERLRNCWTVEMDFVIHSGNGPKISRTIIAIDKFEIRITITIDDWTLRRSVTNCWPNGLSWRYFIIRKNKMPVESIIKKYNRIRKTSILFGSIHSNEGGK